MNASQHGVQYEIEDLESPGKVAVVTSFRNIEEAGDYCPWVMPGTVYTLTGTKAELAHTGKLSLFPYLFQFLSLLDDTAKIQIGS